ncbi:MAG TPA: 2TM domain-containing protein [Polyangia bacterium]|jgi:hypothetical protein|nr:2TM domain-containing protein [Polyangia bacterium]
MADDRRTYTQEDVNAILRRALDRQELASGLSHRELLETAKEVGIEPAALERAITEVEQERELAALREQWRLEKKAALRASLIAWAWVSLLLVLVDVFTPGGPWFYWVIAPWALLLTVRALRLQQGPTPRQLERMDRRRRRDHRRREFERQVGQGAALLGSAIEQGASLLLQRLEEKRQEAEQRRLRGPRGSA